MLFNTYEPWKFAFSSESSNLEEAIPNSWGIIGVPFDSTSSYHTGSRFGPIVIREASFGFEKFNTIFNKELDTIFHDFGDVNTIPGNCTKTSKIIEETVLELLQYNIKPLMIGGEHSISYGSVKSILDKTDNLTVVHLDAHRDLADEFISEECSHATVLRRIYELGLKELIQIGIRSSSKEEEDFVKNKKDITTFKSNVAIDDILKKLDEIDSDIYLTIDMDVFDPSFVPDVSNPTPCGMNPSDIEKILKVLSCKNIVG
ncbi:agmatinase, partial [Methanobrevibacter sp. OttesenSCG-928-I08]|nr:agmatinase [Methanobrevibacter sp. OttesenSCG-928-I08]